MHVPQFIFKIFAMLFVVKETPLGPQYLAKIKGNFSDLLIDFKIFCNVNTIQENLPKSSVLDVFDEFMSGKRYLIWK